LEHATFPETKDLLKTMPSTQIVFDTTHFVVKRRGDETLQGVAPTPFSLFLRLFGTDLRFAPGVSKTRPLGSTNWNQLFFASPRCVGKKRLNEPVKEILLWATSRLEGSPNAKWWTRQ
jgi:hypothetical protein